VIDTFIAMASFVNKSVCIVGVLYLVIALGNVECTSMSRTSSLDDKVETASRKLLAADGGVVKTIFSNGWAPGCYWKASGAFNISVIPGVGVGRSSGLCTTFPRTGGFMSFECSDPDNLPSALRRSSGIQFYISQLDGDQIGSSSADSTIPKGLQLILQGNARTTCTRPLGLGGDINNDLVQTSVMFEGSVSNPSGNDQDCRPALQNANAIGFVSSYGGITFCVDDIQLI